MENNCHRIIGQHLAVLTVRKMDVGTRFNVIVENAVIKGTVRCFDPATQDHIDICLGLFESVIGNPAATEGCCG